MICTDIPCSNGTVFDKVNHVMSKQKYNITFSTEEKGMKRSKLMILLPAAFIMWTGLVSFFGCSKNVSTLEPERKIILDPSELHVLALPVSEADGGLAIMGDPETSVEEWVSADDGGTVELRYKVKRVDVELEFQVLPHSLSDSAKISMSLPDGLQMLADVDMTFGPSGTVFEPAAQLEIDARGLDLSGIDPNKIGFFFYNKEEGFWEKMEATVEVHEASQRVHVTTYVSHFSRYAIAWGE